MNMLTFSPQVPDTVAREGQLTRQSNRSFFYAAVLIALLHAGLLVAVLRLHDTAVPAPHQVDLHTIEAQLISPDAAPVPVQVQSPRIPPVLKPIPKPTSKPILKAPPAPPLPVQAAPSTQAATAAPAAPTPPVTAAPAVSPPLEAPQRATLAATAPKNVEHLECSIARPDYPALSRHNGESGTALVQIVVDTQGRIEAATLRKSSTYTRLDNAALQAAQDSRCRPYLENGEPIRSSAVVPFRFTLDD